MLKYYKSLEFLLHKCIRVSSENLMKKPKALKIKSIFSDKKTFFCGECGSAIKLLDKTCKKCGFQNKVRIMAIQELESREINIKHDLDRLVREMKSKWLIAQSVQLKEMEIDLLMEAARKIKLRRVQLEIGSIPEDRIRWVKSQYHEKNRTIQEIADDLGETMIIVRKYVDSNVQ